MSELRVVSFDLNGRLAWLNDGRQVPITNMFDEEREDTDDPESVFSFVAGSDDICWFGCFMSEYEKALVS